MRERINRLAKGIIDADAPILLIQPESIEEPVQAGELINKELYVADTEGRFIKGLVYSSNIRVRIRNNAFGGNRNHISYEVDSTYLLKGDVISGAFYLVTNGGERKIPYSFSVELGVSKRTLEALKTPADFADMARKDQDMALRLFEYQDFTEAPFMQDMHIRALYDGLKGRPNRQNLLEEFLVALHAKSPVMLETDRTLRQYEGIDCLSQDSLEVRASTWGYVRFDVTADGDFLELPKKTYTSQDFQDGVCHVTFLVNPGHLHRGRNLGRLVISTVRESIEVDIEVQAAEDHLKKVVRSRRELARYLELRLEYELGQYEEQLLINQMKQALDYFSGFPILKAELCILDGEKERAAALLEECRKEVMDQRLEEKDWYCFYQYLQYLLTDKSSYKDNLIRLLQKILYEEKGHPYLFLLLTKLDPDMDQNPGEMLDQMQALFNNGCHSPFLYGKALELYKKNPQLLKNMGRFELQVLFFAAKRDILDRETALRAAQLAAVTRHFGKLYCRLLMGLYEQYPEKVFLEAVCALLIKGDCRDSGYFTWYEKALKQGVSLTRLYEYFLYSLPKDYPYLLPKEILLYFSYEKSMDDYSRSVLYMNIIKYMSPEAPLYRQYERDIEKFTMEQLLHSRVNRRLVVLYRHMIYKEMIDERVAKVLPSILKSYRVRLKNPNMKYVIVCYEELEEEDAFPIQDGVAYVPLFLVHSVLLFQDAYGNRYTNISYHKLPAMETDEKSIRELEERCYDIYPNHPMLRLQECGEIVANGIRDEADMMTLKRVSADLKLRVLYRKKILTQMISCFRSQMETDGIRSIIDAEYLMELELERLTREERAGVCEMLIHQNYTEEAFEIVCRFGCEAVRSKLLFKLCGQMILNQLFAENDMLLGLSCQMFSEGLYDSILLDYLCEYFNGSTRQMYRILSQSVHDHVEIYDMPERLIAQMMFASETDYLDQVFDWYVAGKETSDGILRAYFTMKSADYFLRGRDTGERVFAYLESAVHGMEDKNRIPTIYLLALTKYYSTLEALDQERRSLCQVMVELLLEEGRIFAYFHDLGRLIPMPDSIMERVTIEYRGGREAWPELEVRVLPEEEDFVSDEMRKVYPGIYVRQKVLFEGEILEFRVYETKDGDRRLMAEGSLSRDTQQKIQNQSRFTALNEMGLCLALNEENTLKEKMKKYLTDSAMMEELFPLM